MSISETSKEKILVVTASTELKQELKNTLSSYAITAVSNAEHAIDRLSKVKDFSALLVGIYLDETKGFELLDYIKKNTEFYKGPVLIIVDSIKDSVIYKIKSYNIFDYIIRKSNDLLIQTTVRNAVVYYTEKSKLVNYAVDQVYEAFNDMKSLVSILAQVVEFKNFESGAHTEHVGMFTKILCDKLIEKYKTKYDITKADTYYISLASCLHDIGKVYIPGYILNKPEKLTPEEMEIMKDHAVLGAGIIHKLTNWEERKLFRYTYDICLYHHERFDGSGYPDKLVGSKIPIWAQIVSVADVYDALTSDRVYRKAYDHETAVKMIKEEKCGKFNKDIIACLSECGEAIKAAKQTRTSVKSTKDAFNTIVADILKIK